MGKKLEKLILPAVKGRMGDRDYFVTAMPLNELAARVELAANITTQTELISDRLQRDIKDKRINAISDYLLDNEQRFFNALVVGVFGSPKWRSFKELNPKSFSKHTGFLGFLEFSGDEKMYALDGQHRLRGISVALEKNKSVLSDESVSVVFIAHDSQKRARSRRLFVVLNKNAQKVSKRDIIFLDEDDAAAIITRELIEEEGSIYYKGDRVNISVSSGNTMPIGDTSCFTTVGAFYDCLNELFTKALSDKKSLTLSQSESMSEELRESLLNNTKDFFDMLVQHVPAMQEYYSAKGRNISQTCKKYRNSKYGGHLLFRPEGLKVFVGTVCEVYKHNYNGKYDKEGMAEAIRKAAQLPLLLNEAPAINLIWDDSSHKVLKGFSLLKKIYLYMLDISKDKKKELLKKYQKTIDDSKAELPTKLSH